jgi:hypothetical protein
MIDMAMGEKPDGDPDGGWRDGQTFTRQHSPEPGPVNQALYFGVIFQTDPLPDLDVRT